MSQFVAVHVDRYLRRLFPSVSVTVANRPELYATEIYVMVKTLSGNDLYDQGHVIPKEIMKYPGEYEHLAADIAFSIARDIMMHKPLPKEIH